LKPSEIRNMTEPEIEQSILTLKEKLFTLRSEASTGRIERPQYIRDAKRDIARCYTILKEKTSGQ
jgi:large subunit ribosomal protein L29